MSTTSSGAETVSFRTTLTATGNNTGIVVPIEVLEKLGAGKRPAVQVEVNGFEYRSTVGSMGGSAMISVSAAIRKESGLQADDDLFVTLRLVAAPREVDIPAELEAAFVANDAARTFFSSLSNSLQRLHVDNINAAMTAKTRDRRVQKAVALFLVNKPR